MTGKSVDVSLDNIKVDINSDSNINADINSTSNMDMTANVDSKSNINLDTSKIHTEIVLPQPLKTESRFAITEPIVSQNTSDIGLDIRPMVMDFCFKFEFGKLPPTCIRRPYHHHLGVTLFGIELFGLTFSGDSTIMIDEVQKRPQVVWGGEEERPEGQRHHSEPHVEPGDVRIRLGS